MTTRRVPLVKSPALAQVPDEYESTPFNRIVNTLRLYFNQVDAAFSTLLGTRGGRILNNPYGAFSNSATQSLAAASTPYVVVLNTTDYGNGVTLASNKMTVAQDGIYNCQFSLQFENTTAQIIDAWVWIRKNGADVAGTASTWAVVASHGGTNGYAIGACNFFVNLVANDYIELIVAADATGLNIEAYTNATLPFVRPSVPSSVVTLSFVSAPT